MHAASVCPEPESNSPTKNQTHLSVGLSCFEFDQKSTKTALCVPTTLQLLKIVPLDLQTRNRPTGCGPSSYQVRCSRVNARQPIDFPRSALIFGVSRLGTP